MQVDFYHLGHAPIAAVLPRIAERVTGSGARLLVVADDAALLERLDRDLWAYAADAFLPHGRTGQGGEAHQPVLLSTTLDPLNAARNVALVDGRWRAEALDYDRSFHFFDDESIEPARAAWRSLNDVAGLERRFWRQDEDGRWTRVA
ncbi:DNA polymerase III subunit chi [Sphingomonas montana]|uniref:DNA polymerase III subunit chi n=1 Tax=Sphingomonas montana TaxID=1843236 RepID=UPI00096CD1EE|nr:DNA polymerase III subunit chi [Sphingomonas montana]